MGGKDKLAVFDLDGTLFDTAEANFQAYRDAAMELGFEIHREAFLKEFEGKGYKAFLPLLGISEKFDWERIHERKKRLYPQHLKDVKGNEHLFRIIRGIRKEYQIALATMASRKNAMDILRAFGMDGYFDFLISQEDVVNLKPDPECYRLAIMKASVSPENTIIFEDSDVGVQAARAVGASVMIVNRF